MATREQMERESILAVMRDMGGPVSYQQITDRAGPRLASTLMEMVQEGVVTRQDASRGEPALYRPSSSHGRPGK